jgi:hypothetical protein
VTKDVKKDVNACIDFIITVVKGHFLSCACNLFGVTSLDEPLVLPPGIHTAPASEKSAFISKMARMVVECCSLIEGSFTGGPIRDKQDGVYNYARVLCHYGSLVMEFRDAWHEGDGERVIRCWKLFMPHFKVAGCTKYSLEALRLHIQASITFSPNLAHQLTWNRFVNVKGGVGNNIPCDLFCEHNVNSIKHIVTNMGSNLTESSLQRAARSVTTLDKICETFDNESGVPCRTTAHATRSDVDDVKKVVKLVLQNKLLVQMENREHRSFKGMKLNPLHEWDITKTKQWIQKKIKEYQKYQAKFRSDVSESDIEGDLADIEGALGDIESDLGDLAS